MKAEINGMKLEGTPREIAEFINIKEAKSTTDFIKKLTISDKTSPFDINQVTCRNPQTFSTQI